MSTAPAARPRIAIACGGTGGHLFPGLAVAEELRRRGCEVCLFVSPKEVDQAALRQAAKLEIITLPAIGLTRGRIVAFLRGFLRSYSTARKVFAARPSDAALAMGGFTSGPPLLAARQAGALTFLHESNTVPGRANRWLSWMVSGCFIGFASSAEALHCGNVTVTGTPVRPQFHPRNAKECRLALELDPDREVILVMGGSQGASGINALVARALALLTEMERAWQWLHLAGPADVEKLQLAYAAKATARVIPFLGEMDLALGAASAAISRAGASSLAELAAMRVPAVLVPYPAATGNHQFFNAKAFEETGAARMLEQKTATPEALLQYIRELVHEQAERERIRAALAQWDKPHAAEEIVEAILVAVQRRQAAGTGLPHTGGAPCSDDGSHRNAGTSRPRPLDDRSNRFFLPASSRP